MERTSQGTTRSQRRLKMSDLARATDTPKSTIHHYVQLGLLPEPVKTSRNMAYYEPGCVDRIRLIRMLQTHHRLTLAEIGGIVAAAGSDEELRARLELNMWVFDSADEDSVGIDAAARACSLKRGQIDSLLEAGLITPLVRGRFDRADIEAGRRYADAFAFGFTIDDLRFYTELLGEVVDREFALREQAIAGMDDTDNAEATLRMGRNAQVIRTYLLRRIFQERVSRMRNLSTEDES